MLARFAAFCASRFPGLHAPTRASVGAWMAAARRRGSRAATLRACATPCGAGPSLGQARGIARPTSCPPEHCPGPTVEVYDSRTSIPTQGLAALFDQTDPLSLRLAGPVPAPDHAGPVPHDLRLRPACLRRPAAALRRHLDLVGRILTMHDGRGGRGRAVPGFGSLRCATGWPASTPVSPGAPSRESVLPRHVAHTLKRSPTSTRTYRGFLVAGPHSARRPGPRPPRPRSAARRLMDSAGLCAALSCWWWWGPDRRASTAHNPEDSDHVAWQGAGHRMIGGRPDGRFVCAGVWSGR